MFSTDVLAASRIGVKGTTILTTWWSRPKLKQKFIQRMKENIDNLPSYLLSNLCLNSKDKNGEVQSVTKTPYLSSHPQAHVGSSQPKYIQIERSQ